MAHYLDALLWSMVFLVAAVSAWPSDESDPKWAQFGYLLLVLCAVRAFVWWLERELA